MSVPDRSSPISANLARQRFAWREVAVQLAPVVLILFVFALFARTLTFGLYLDDHHHARPWALGEVLGTFAGPFDPLGIEPVYFRPLAVVSFAIDWNIWGYTIWGYHLTNILLHTLATVLVYFLLRRMQISWWAAWCAAAFFAAIPANAATAVYISERSDALVAIFTVAGLLSLDTYHRTGRVRWIVLLNLMFVGAVCSKEIGIALPLVAVLYWLQVLVSTSASASVAGNGGPLQSWRAGALLVWQALTAREQRRAWMLIIGPLALLSIGYLGYRGLVLPTGMLGARYSDSNIVRSLLSAIYWTFKGVPWEVSGLALPFLAGSFGLALFLRPQAPAWRMIVFGFAWVVACCLPLSYAGQVEPRLLYVVEVGVAIMLAGLLTIVASLLTDWSTLQPSWRRLASGVLVAMLVAMVVATSISTVQAQNEFQPGSQKMLQADYQIWTDLTTRSLYPEHYLKQIEQRLRDANMLPAGTP